MTERDDLQMLKDRIRDKTEQALKDRILSNNELIIQTKSSALVVLLQAEIEDDEAALMKLLADRQAA